MIVATCGTDAKSNDRWKNKYPPFIPIKESIAIFILWILKGEIKLLQSGKVTAITKGPSPPKIKRQTESSGPPIPERIAKNSADAWPGTNTNTAKYAIYLYLCHKAKI